MFNVTIGEKLYVIIHGYCEMCAPLQLITCSYYNDSDWHVDNEENVDKYIMSEDESAPEESRPKIYSRESGYVK